MRKCWFLPWAWSLAPELMPAYIRVVLPFAGPTARLVTLSSSLLRSISAVSTSSVAFAALRTVCSSSHQLLSQDVMKCARKTYNFVSNSTSSCAATSSHDQPLWVPWIEVDSIQRIAESDLRGYWCWSHDVVELSLTLLDNSAFKSKNQQPQGRRCNALQCSRC